MGFEFVRFVIVGGIGFGVDAGGTWLLVQAGLPPVGARIGPLLAAIVVTWLLNRSLTFRTSRPKSRAELMRYAAIALSSAALNFLLYSVLVLLGVPVLVAVAMASGVLMAYSFFAYRSVVFQ